MVVQILQLASNKKGQSVIADLMLSMAIFMVLLVVLYSSWTTHVRETSNTLLQFRAEQSANRALLAITKSPGFPSNWALLHYAPDDDKLIGIGTAQSYNVLDSKKLLYLNSIYSSNYNKTKTKMGLSIFDADIKITYLNSTVLYTMGSSPNLINSTLYASKTQLAYIDNAPVKVRVRVWKEN